MICNARTRAFQITILKRSVVFTRGRPFLIVMALVMKFGGTSVADAAAFDNVARIVAKEHEASPVVIVSAMSGVTDSLLASTNIAVEADAREASASLEKVFHRYVVAAA